MKSSNPCERCGTKRFKKKSDGTMVCKNGHVLLGWTEETQDEGIIYMGKRRKQKKVHSNVEEDKGRFIGADRDSVILQICQKGLSILVEHCVREFGFPDDIQRIAQNLWELYVVSTEKSVTFDIFAENEEELGDVDANEAKLPAATITVEDELGVDLGVMHDNVDSNDDNNDEEKYMHAWPQLRYSNVILFIFLTFKYARLPVLLSDVHRWCTTSQLPYMETLHSIPERIVRHLDKAFIYTFKHIPSIHILYASLVRFRICYKQYCGLVFSDANIPVIMHRLYPHFGLPGAML
ncbi:hypothetical protein BDB00DRAFT_516211 [Zychaea mexicana]|uniref:uncharacterized protein n=1 Tax=Zychaea mexicana TaxID=64656 RepID=UPI0022FE863A|nr:uncharacterized protein BDB00DRAFT_516211 [Zychaea mexicana]KAI9491156.1 hypothetical protein BDB00DRAFT_516211 [Zychaea mexicana]